MQPLGDGTASSRDQPREDHTLSRRPELAGVTLAGVSRKILYVDLDNTLVDFPSRIEGLDPAIIDKYKGRLDEAPGIFALMRPLPGAIDAFRELAQLFDTYYPVHRAVAQSLGLATQDRMGTRTPRGG